MNKNIKYLVAGIALILFVLPSLAGQLPDPNAERDCYKWGTTEGLFMCFEPITGVYAMWFSTYISMHDYYTPQLKENSWSVGNLAGSQKKITIGLLEITGSPSYTYTKHI